jgi:two-component system, OmpR family, KDP operon response regulator KdpE
MPNVVIASTNAAVVQGLELKLRSHDFSVVTYDSAETFMGQLAQSDPTVTLIGEEMDCQPGFRISRWFRDNAGRGAVIVMGADQPESAIDALEAGADDYISREADFRELICRIRALLRRFPS